MNNNKPTNDELIAGLKHMRQTMDCFTDVLELLTFVSERMLKISSLDGIPGAKLRTATGIAQRTLVHVKAKMEKSENIMRSVAEFAQENKLPGPKDN